MTECNLGPFIVKENIQLWSTFQFNNKTLQSLDEVGGPIYASLLRKGLENWPKDIFTKLAFELTLKFQRVPTQGLFLDNLYITGKCNIVNIFWATETTEAQRNKNLLANALCTADFLVLSLLSDHTHSWFKEAYA